MSERGTILVTGGAGYIGSHACKALSRAGYLPVAYDNLVHGHEWAAKWGPLERGDILDEARLEEVMSRHRPRAVMHFAAFAYVGESVSEPAKYYRNNVAGSLALLESCRRKGIDRFVFSSTCATYGVPDALPIHEETPQRPINPYGASKLMVERVLADFGAAYGLRSVALRYFNAAGADPDGEIGEDHAPEPHIIPLVLDAAAGKRESISIFGDDYDTPDGTCIRDFIHVTDLADAHVKALQKLEGGGLQRAAHNLGTGSGVSVLQLIRAAERVTGKAIKVTHGPRRPGDPPELVADASAARAELGWIPVMSDVDTILRTAWEWHRRGSSSVASRPA